jgi:hypothetical protein
LKPAYRTSPPRVLLALVLGAVIGALMVTVWFNWDTAQDRGVRYLLDYWPSLILEYFELALAVWAFGLIAVGLVPWWLLHKAGRRDWRVAVTLGAALTFAVVFALGTNGFGLIPHAPGSDYSASDSGGLTIDHFRITRHGWLVALQEAGVFAAIGAVIGGIIWRTAYRHFET